MTSLKADMKRLLSVTFPELEHITGVFTKATLLPMPYKGLISLLLQMFLSQKSRATDLVPP